MAETFAGLHTMTENQLIEKVNTAFEGHAGGGGLDLKPIFEVQLFLNELMRREQDRATQAMVKLTEELHRFTKQMRNMTIAILIATIVSIALSVIALLKP